MTYPVGTTPTDALDSTGLADFASTTEEEWEASIT